MSSPAPNSLASKSLAAAAPAGEGRLAVVIFAPAGASDPSEPRWTIVASRVVEAGHLGSLPELFAEHRVDRVVRVAPLSRTVARVAKLGAASDADLLAASSLIAEAELPQSAPLWRRAGGVLPGVVVEDAPYALLTAWIDADQPVPLDPQRAESWCTVPAALAAIRGMGGIVGWRDASGLALLAVGDRGVLARTVRLASADSAGGVLAESAAAVGLPEPPPHRATHGASHRLIAEPESVADLRSRVAGVRDDAAWLDDHALAIGAALVALDQPMLAPLARLSSAEPVVERTRLERAAIALARPRTAAAVLAACVVLAILLPILTGLARVAILSAKAEGLEAGQSSREETERLAAMYQQLDRDRWPMTKLLADISRATPVAVTVTNLRLTTEQGLSIQGVAPSLEDVTSLQGNLNRAGPFRNVRQERAEGKPGVGVEFSLTADVSSPHTAARLPEDSDFASKTLAVRLHGEGASNRAVPAAATQSGTRPRAGATGGAGRAGPAAADAEARRSASATDAGPPKELSDADIAGMDRGTAMREWAGRKAYISKNRSLDAAIKQRLEAEVDKLKARMDALRGSAGGGAGGSGGGGS